MPNRVPPILPIEGVPEKLLQAVNSRFRQLETGTGTGTGVGTGQGTPGASGPPGPPGTSGGDLGALSLAISGGPASVGIPYFGALIASGGTQPYMFSITVGALPPGLSLDSATGQIDGTPTLAGAYTFTAQVVDSATTPATLTQSCTITVNNQGLGGPNVGLPSSCTITYQSWANAIVPVFSGFVTMPSTANVVSIVSVSVFAVSPAGKQYLLDSYNAPSGGFTAGSALSYSGWNSQVIQTASNQTGWSLEFVCFDQTWTALADAYTITGLTILAAGNLPPIDSVVISEVAGSRYQNPPGGNTYLTVQVIVTYHDSQVTIPVFTLWDNQTGASQKWVGWFQGKVGSTSTAAIEFFIPLGVTNYQVFAAPGTYQPGTTVPAYAVGSNVIPGLTIGAPSATAAVLGITNTAGAAPTVANIYVGMNPTYPYAEVIVSVDTAGPADTATYFYDIWVEWTDATGTPVTPGGIENRSGWQHMAEVGNDGNVFREPLLINYPTGDYYLRIEVWARTRNSNGTGPPFTGDTGATPCVWPGGLGGGTRYLLHVSTAPPGGTAPVPATLGLSFAGSAGLVNSPLSATLAATGGTAPYAFSIFSGALPTGLSLNSVTGLISGTPTLAGTTTFTAKVTDAVNATATVSCTITIGSSGTQTGVGITATANPLTYQSWANAIVPVFNGTVVLPATSTPNYSSLAQVWVYAVSPATASPPNAPTVIQVLSDWGILTSVPFSGWSSSILQTPSAQSGWSLRFEPLNSSGVLIGTPYIITGITIAAAGSSTTVTPSGVTIAETGPRNQNPPGGNTYTTVTATITYAQSQPTIPVFTIWHSFNNGTTIKWFGWFQGQLGTTSTAVLTFFIPLGSNTYKVWVAPGTFNGDTLATGAIASSNTLSLTIGAPSGTPGGSSIMSITNITGAAPTQSNIFMGSNSLGNPWAEVLIKCATPGNADTSPFYYELWVAWVDSSGNLVTPGGVANNFGWIQGWRFANDGTLGVMDLKINYPSADYYLEFRVYGRSRNWSAPTPPVSSDAATTQMQWPGGLLYYRLHVGSTPGAPGGTVTPSTGSNTNVGLSILSNPSFESSIPGQIMGPNNTGQGPGFMYPGWVVDCQSSTSFVTIIGAGGHSGPNFVRLTGSSTVVKQGFAIAPALPIYIQFYVQSNNPGTGTPQLDITIFYLSSTLGLIGQSTVGTAVAPYISWSLISLIIQASAIPAGANLGILAFKTHFAAAATQTWDIDDVFVQQPVAQTNSGQDQSMGADSIPVGLHNNAVATTATSYYGLDRFRVLGTDGSTGLNCIVNAPSAQLTLHYLGVQNGYQFDANNFGTNLTITQAGVSKNGINTTTFKDGNGALHTVWNGIIVS